MNDKITAAIFGSKERSRIIRLFVFNPGKLFTTKSIGAKVGASKGVVEREVGNLIKAGIIAKVKRKKEVGFMLAENFAYLKPLSAFLLATSPDDKDIGARLAKAGKMRLIVVAGIFNQNADSRLDLLAVGDGLKKAALDRAINSLEADIGKELSFSVLETPDFKYRLSVRDKLILDVLDYDHRKIVNKLGI